MSTNSEVNSVELRRDILILLDHYIHAKARELKAIHKEDFDLNNSAIATDMANGIVMKLTDDFKNVSASVIQAAISPELIMSFGENQIEVQHTGNAWTANVKFSTTCMQLVATIIALLSSMNFELPEHEVNLWQPSREINGFSHVIKHLKECKGSYLLTTLTITGAAYTHTLQIYIDKEYGIQLKVVKNDQSKQ